MECKARDFMGFMGTADQVIDGLTMLTTEMQEKGDGDIVLAPNEVRMLLAKIKVYEKRLERLAGKKIDIILDRLEGIATNGSRFRV